MRILCFGYRSWAVNIYARLQKETKNQFIVTGDRELVKESVIQSLNPSMVLFFGWSWIVPKEVIQSYPCFMLHPSDLPKYRGGSPIQNQILDGVKNSKLCLFRMKSELDSGPIYGKRNLELTGEISDIFTRLEDLGTELTLDLLHNKIEVEEQKKKSYLDFNLLCGLRLAFAFSRAC